MNIKKFSALVILLVLFLNFNTYAEQRASKGSKSRVFFVIGSAGTALALCSAGTWYFTKLSTEKENKKELEAKDNIIANKDNEIAEKNKTIKSISKGDGAIDVEKVLANNEKFTKLKENFLNEKDEFDPDKLKKLLDDLEVLPKEVPPMLIQYLLPSASKILSGILLNDDLESAKQDMLAFKRFITLSLGNTK